MLGAERPEEFHFTTKDTGAHKCTLIYYKLSFVRLFFVFKHSFMCFMNVGLACAFLSNLILIVIRNIAAVFPHISKQKVVKFKSQSGHQLCFLSLAVNSSTRPPKQ